MSAEKIIKRIEDDTQLECEQIISAAKEKAEEIIADSKKEAAQKAAEIDEKSKKDCEEVLRRRLQIAELDIRKKNLAVKREVLDEAIAGAMKNICSLPQKDWEDLIVKNVVANALTGDEKLMVRADEKAKFAAILPRINKELAASGKNGNVTIDSEAAGFIGGFALVSSKIELNCSFEVMLREARTRLERNITDMLFSAEVR